jgi:hypothetical protein
MFTFLPLQKLEGERRKEKTERERERERETERQRERERESRSKLLILTYPLILNKFKTSLSSSLLYCSNYNFGVNYV